MKIELTDREAEIVMDGLGLLMDALAAAVDPMFEEVADLEGDFREAIARQDDEWGLDRGPDSNDDQNFAQTAEACFIQEGVDAREKQKKQRAQAFGDSDIRTDSMAEQLVRMMQGTATPFVEEDE